jgi:methylthioribose-1-phosphate isomerase
MIPQAVKWVGGLDGVLELIDQRRLPAEFVKLRIRSVEQLHEAIQTLAVRGAPAIGVAAAYGPVLALQWLKGRQSVPEVFDEVSGACTYLASSRPTAVNLFWALDRMRRLAEELAAEPETTVSQLKEALLAEANAIYDEDVAMCRQIGRYGEGLIRAGMGV